DADPTTGAVVAGLRAGWVGTASTTTLESIDASVPDAGLIPAVTYGVRTFAGRGGGDMASKEDLVSGVTCDTVNATQSCKPRVGTPCLTCTTVQLAFEQCRG